MSRFNKLTVGVLALQGDYELHQRQLDALGVNHTQVRLPEQLDRVDGLIMPGGESTTMNILIDRFGLRDPLRQFALERPIYGTCAGMILLAHRIVDNQSGVEPLDLIDIDVVRNGYGRQVHSFEANLRIPLNGMQDCSAVLAAFIRAPRVIRTGKKVRIIASYRGDPVLVSQGNILASSFHAEVGGRTGLLEFFVSTFLYVPCDR